MNAIYDALVGLVPAQDAELQEGYERYASLLATFLTPQQLEDYAAFIRQTGEVRILEELTPAEFAMLPPQIQAVARAILDDQNIIMENRRVVALLNQRGQHAVAPDLGPQ
jgi:hypothetical protein